MRKHLQINIQDLIFVGKDKESPSPQLKNQALWNTVTI